MERDHNLKELSKLVGTPSSMLYDYLGTQAKRELNKRGLHSSKPPSLSEADGTLLNHRDRLIHYFLSLVLAFPDSFFKHFEKLADFSSFEKKAEALGLVKPFNKLDPEKYSVFYREFAESLGAESSVYKQIHDHYNAQGTVDEDFLSGLEDGPKLQKMALEAEVKNTDPEQLNQEFEKVLTLLYFEYLAEPSLPKRNGTN